MDNDFVKSLIAKADKATGNDKKRLLELVSRGKSQHCNSHTVLHHFKPNFK
jgi:hypothetical protein